MTLPCICHRPKQGHEQSAHCQGQFMWGRAHRQSWTSPSRSWDSPSSSTPGNGHTCNQGLTWGSLDLSFWAKIAQASSVLHHVYMSNTNRTKEGNTAAAAAAALPDLKPDIFQTSAGSLQFPTSHDFWLVPLQHTAVGNHEQRFWPHFRLTQNWEVFRT